MDAAQDSLGRKRGIEHSSIYIKQATFRLLCNSDPPTLIRVPGPTQA